jgi:hypothetical protein
MDVSDDPLSRFVRLSFVLGACWFLPIFVTNRMIPIWGTRDLVPLPETSERT